MSEQKHLADVLADWCQANSSGIYRPSAEAADMLRTIPALEAERDQLKAINAELLSVLHVILNNNESLVGEVTARAAIAKAAGRNA